MKPLGWVYSAEKNRWRLELAEGYVYTLYYWVELGEPDCWALTGTSWAPAHVDSDDAATPPWEWANGLVRQHVRDKSQRDLATAEKLIAAARLAMWKVG